jgi:hypothetical protein
MQFYIPKELIETKKRGSLRFEHGEKLDYATLMTVIEHMKSDLNEVDPDLVTRPGFTFDRVEFVKAQDGSTDPCFDVEVHYCYDKSPDELTQLKKDHDEYVARRMAEFARREAEQKDILEAILKDIKKDSRTIHE